MKSRAGFTLIELLIVVIIVGVTSAVAIANYISYSQRAKIGEVMRYAKSMQDSYAQYYVQTGTAPATLANLNLTSVTTTYIASTAYNVGATQLQVNVNVSALDVGVGGAGCTLYYLFRPTVTGDVLTWSCARGTNNFNAACTTLVGRVSPAECP